MLGSMARHPSSRLSEAPLPGLLPEEGIAPAPVAAALPAPDPGPDPATDPDPGREAAPAPDPLSDAELRKGHRKRLRERFMRAGVGALQDYELLELVLFRAIPHRDLKPLAKRLLHRFGDFNGVISARVSLLLEMDGIGEAAIQELKIVEAAAHSLARARIMHREVLSSWAALMTYCKTAMAHRETEQFRILFLDRKNVLIADEAQQDGTVDHVPVYPREVARRALELNASAVILVHNHPSGNPEPSQADIDMTRMVEAAMMAIGVTLHDHVIIGKAEDTSFRSRGLL